MRLNSEQLEELLPTDSVREAFMRREDIKGLPEDERERRWAEHQGKLKSFMEFLTKVDCYVLPKG